MDLLNKVFGWQEEEKTTIQTVVRRESKGVFQVQDVFFIQGIGVIVVGKVISGTISVGDKAAVNGKATKIKSIESHHKQQQIASTGENIGIALREIGKEDIQAGTQIYFE